MEITIIMIHKTSESFIAEGMNHYLEKARAYVKIQSIELNGSSIIKGEKAMEEEGRLILKKLKVTDHVCLLDENGRLYDSVRFAMHLQKIFNSGVKRVVFVVGGAYGVSEELRGRADSVISLSPMTFSHQLVRIILSEQLYRALNIIHGGKYHH